MPVNNNCNKIVNAKSGLFALMDSSFYVDDAELENVVHDFESADDTRRVVPFWVILSVDPEHALPLLDVGEWFAGYEVFPQGSLWLHCVEGHDYSVHVLQGNEWILSEPNSNTCHPLLKNSHSLEHRFEGMEEPSLVLGWETAEESTSSWGEHPSPWNALLALRAGKNDVNVDWLVSADTSMCKSSRGR
jgi:hypothetical protein